MTKWYILAPQIAKLSIWQHGKDSKEITADSPQDFTLDPLYALFEVWGTDLVGLVVHFHTEQASFSILITDGLKERGNRKTSDSANDEPKHKGFCFLVLQEH